MTRSSSPSKLIVLGALALLAGASACGSCAGKPEEESAPPPPVVHDGGHARFFRRDSEFAHRDGGRRLFFPLRHHREGGAPDAVAPAPSIE